MIRMTITSLWARKRRLTGVSVAVAASVVRIVSGIWDCTSKASVPGPPGHAESS